jgi:hypothetical protein
LNRNGTLHRIDDTGKFSQQIVPGRVQHDAIMLLYESGYHLTVGCYRAHSGLFIIAHEATVAFGICT